ncbi:MAG: hypothetical protein GDA36_07220 [Rhodobacteraceae bacterium]|nr:hypothetical protein [Paracoccaceae bacterium]
MPRCHCRPWGLLSSRPAGTPSRIILRGDGDTFYDSYYGYGEKTFDDVNIMQNGDDVVITWGTDDSVTLRDYDASALTVDDFDLLG